MSDIPMTHVHRAESGAKVLSAWFHDRRFQKAWRPEEDLFVLPEHRAVAGVMAQLQPPVDSDGLMLALHRHGAMKHFSDGLEGVQAVIHAPAVVDPWQELQRLRELAALSALRSGLQQALGAMSGNEGVSLDEARHAVTEALAASTRSIRPEAKTVKQMLADALHEALSQRTPGLTTGLSEMDGITGGLRPGSVFVFGAEANWGKTAYLILLWHLALKAGRRPGIVSAEDPENLYARRLLAMRAKISALRIRDHKLRRWEQDRANDVVGEAEEVKCFLDARGRPIESVVADMRSLTLSEGIDLWLVDYLQAFDTLKDFGERRHQVNYIARQVANVTEQSDIALMLFSQVTRETGKKLDKYSLRESKDLANMATVVMLGQLDTTEEIRDGRTVPVQQRSIFVDKVKDGPSKFTFEIPWNRLFAGFEADTTGEQQETMYEDE